MNRTLDNYRGLLKEVAEKDLHLDNTDFDTGKMTHAGEYVLTDNAYARLLDQLARDNFQQITPELRDNILAFYADRTLRWTKRKPAAWDKTQDELQKLKGMTPPASPSIQLSGQE